MSNRFKLVLSLFCCISLEMLAQTVPVYDFMLVETGEFSSRANTINEEGLIGGSRIIQPSSSGISPAESYLWLDGSIIWSGHLGGQLSGVAAVNNDGKAIGQAKIAIAPFNGGNCGFELTMDDLDMQPLIPLSVFDYNSVNYAYSLNNQGHIVGNSRIYDEELEGEPYNAYHATLWDQEGNILDLGTLGAGYSRAFAINDHNEIGGAAIPTNGDILHAVRWTIGADETIQIEDIHNIPNSNFSDVIDMNNAGAILGEALINGTDNRVVLWDSTNNSTVLDIANGASCYAGAINDQGTIVGHCEVFENGTRINKAFLYQDESFYFLENIVDNLEGGRSFEFAYDINNQGWIVGSSTLITDGEVQKQSYCLKPQENTVALSDLTRSPFNEAKVSPNPSNGQPVMLHLDVKERTSASILVIDALGRKVATLAEEQELYIGTHTFNWQPTTQLSNGVYQLYINFQSGRIALPLQLIR